jgi:hypothetical protein
VALCKFLFSPILHGFPTHVLVAFVSCHVSARPFGRWLPSPSESKSGAVVTLVGSLMAPVTWRTLDATEHAPDDVFLRKRASMIQFSTCITAMSNNWPPHSVPCSPVLPQTRKNFGSGRDNGDIISARLSYEVYCSPSESNNPCRKPR